jgi:hypothetical protein
VHRSGQITLNSTAFEAIGEPETVELYFNRGEQLVALRPVDVTAEDGYRVRKLSHTTARGISGQAFFRTYGVALGTAQSYKPDLFGGMLVFRIQAE